MRSVKRLALVCMMVLCVSAIFAVPVSAETLLERAGFPTSCTLVEGDAAEDTATILTRGNHLAQGYIRLENEGNRVVRITGTTDCHRTCDKVICNMYLEQMDDNGNWYTYKYWNCYTTNASTYSPAKNVSVEGGHWYRASGGHSAILNGVTESVSTGTNGIWIG